MSTSTDSINLPNINIFNQENNATAPEIVSKSPDEPSNQPSVAPSNQPSVAPSNQPSVEGATDG